MGKEESFEKLRSIGQQHLLEGSIANEEEFVKQIESINIPTFRMQQLLLEQKSASKLKFLDPFEKIAYSGNQKMIQKGKELIQEGKVGCLIVAGGMGTRLGVQGPKGLYPILPGKTLFQIAAEKIYAVGSHLPLAIMTSPQNHEATVAYFEENHYFGLTNVSFFTQGTLPYLNDEGNLFLDHGRIAMGPDGNGGSLNHFYKSGIWKKWYDKGVRYLNYILIDNPLADPFDAELIGYHHSENVDIVIKCTRRKSPKENVGILIEVADKPAVIEYSELPEAERTAVREDGTLKHIAANLSLFSFSMDFIQEQANAELPLHLAYKAKAWKFEKFIFDLIPLAFSVKALLYPREECFAPLKNATGSDSPETVRAALQKGGYIK